ncbi:MAG TPA: hypothetical protein O0X23_03235 [Methanocorpusculum sp.]|nr:hypothetical protein [Methanocorpusculum sp.]
MILAEHYYQRVDLEGNCCIEATRDDTDDIQDCHYSVWKNGRKIHEGWLIYNIQYDYIRARKWWHGKLYYDNLKSDNTYGHLAEEYFHLPPPGGSPYPNNWEAVTPRGSDYFRQHGICGASPIVLECNVCFCICFYIPSDLREIPMSLIDSVKPLTSWECGIVDDAKKIYEEHTPEERKAWRLEFLREHSKEIGVEIPYDPRFID